MKSSDPVDSWVFKNLLKVIIDTLILLLNLFRPIDKKPKPPSPKPKPYIPLPNKPIFPWLRKKIDQIIKDNK